MKSLKDYEEDIYKCSRCGLCQSVCPVYQTTLNDCAVSRGKFNILNGVLTARLDMGIHYEGWDVAKVKEYLDNSKNILSISSMEYLFVELSKELVTFIIKLFKLQRLIFTLELSTKTLFISIFTISSGTSIKNSPFLQFASPVCVICVETYIFSFRFKI